MKKLYEIPEVALCSECNELKSGEDFSKAHFLTYNNNAPVCKKCIGIRRFKANHKSYETKVENEILMKDHIFTILGYDLNRDIHEQFLERHPELQKK
jgi:hypothetical protein